MAPRAIWKGTINVGLVSVPVKLYSAVRTKDVRFNELHATDNARLKHQRICPADGEEVPFDEIVRGFELSPDRYVVIEPEEIEQAAPASTRAVQIDRFVDQDSVDPIYYEKSYHLGPDKGGDQTYTLLARALAATGKVGIGKVVLRTKEYLASVRPSGDGLILSTMHFSDEIVEPHELEGAPEDDIELRDRELAIADQLVDSLSADFEHAKYEDTYREQVMALIQAKAEGKEIELAPREEPEATDDLLAALEASLAAAKPKKKAKAS
jgi:DNA end-binding protein Ku